MRLVKRFRQQLMLISILLITFFSYISVGNAASQALTPAMWKVEHQGTTSYLFGSIHIGKSDWYPLPNYITQAFNKSSTLVVELDPTAHAASMASQMMLPAGETLEKSLSPQTYNKLVTYLSNSGMPISAFTQFKPWAVSTVVALLPYLKAGLDPKFGIDTQFIGLAQTKNMSLVELETPEFQINLISGLFSDEKVLIEMMELPDSESQKLIKFWVDGKVTKIEELLIEQMTPSQLDAMLINRNKNWVAKLTGLFNTNKSHFVVVGAAHLAGDNGVPALLKNAGMDVIRIK